MPIRAGMGRPARLHAVSRRHVSAFEVTTGPAQIVAAVMTVTNAAVWLLASRWERPGKHFRLRVQVRPPFLIRRGGNLVQAFPLVYPVFVLVAPGWGYDGALNWSSGLDLVLQSVGLVLWAVGIAVVLWAVHVMGGYAAVTGVTVHHQLVSAGPYRLVRHPIYTSVIAITVGTTLIFRSHLLLGVAVFSLIAHSWWAAAEEELLSSAEGLGESYRTYASRTGRFLPKVWRNNRSTTS